MSETIEKLATLRSYLKAHQLDGIVLHTRANFAWLSGGGDNHVVSQSEHGVGALLVTAKQAFLVANRIEIDRLHHEEPLSAFTPKVFPWTQPIHQAVEKLVACKRCVTDDPAAIGLPALSADDAYALRAVLCESEIRRYKALGRDCSLVIETVARQVQKGDSEHQVEADLARHLLARGIQPHVLLVAFDQRIERYRHPVPTANHLRHCAMLVVCGQRGGLIANLTRFLHFGPVPAELHARLEAVCRIEAAYWQATVPGSTYGAALKAGIAQYKNEGFAKDWELHHQGGPTGYLGREFMATPEDAHPIHDHQAVAWNPSLPGIKSEDTILLAGSGRIVLTAASADWPSVTVRTAQGQPVVRPGILVR